VISDCGSSRGLLTVGTLDAPIAPRNVNEVRRAQAGQANDGVPGRALRRRPLRGQPVTRFIMRKMDTAGSAAKSSWGDRGVGDHDE